MAREGDSDVAPPPSILANEEYRSKPSEHARSRVLSPVPRSHNSDLQDLANSPLNYEGLPNMDSHYDEDASSLIQEKSEAETPLPVVSPPFVLQDPI